MISLYRQVVSVHLCLATTRSLGDDGAGSPPDDALPHSSPQASPEPCPWWTINDSHLVILAVNDAFVEPTWGKPGQPTWFLPTVLQTCKALPSHYPDANVNLK